MKKTLLLSLFLVCAAFLSAKTILKKPVAPLTDNKETIYLLDSIHLYTYNEEVTSKVFTEYNDNHLEISSKLYEINLISGEEVLAIYDSTFYDANNNIVLYQQFTRLEGEFILDTYEEITYNKAGLIATIKEYKYSELTEEFSLIREETHTYDENGFLLERMTISVSSGSPVPPEPPMPPFSPINDSPSPGEPGVETRIISRSVFSDYIEVGKPGKEAIYGFNQDYVTSNVTYEYDDNKNLISKISTDRYPDDENEGEFIEKEVTKIGYSYNRSNQLTETISYYTAPGIEGFMPSEKTINMYDPETSCLVKEENYAALWDDLWELQSKLIYFWNEFNATSPSSVCQTEIINDITVFYHSDTQHIRIEGYTAIDQISLYTIKGDKVVELHKNVSSINTSGIPAGIYLLQVTSDNKNTIRKVLINE